MPLKIMYNSIYFFLSFTNVSEIEMVITIIKIFHNLLIVVWFCRWLRGVYFSPRVVCISRFQKCSGRDTHIQHSVAVSLWCSALSPALHVRWCFLACTLIPPVSRLLYGWPFSRTVVFKVNLLWVYLVRFCMFNTF